MNTPDPIIAYATYSMLTLFVQNPEIPKREWVDSEANSRLGGLISPTDWQDAMIYIRYLNHINIVLSGQHVSDGKYAIGLYHGRYVIDKLPRLSIEDIVSHTTFPKSTPDLQNPEPAEYWTDEFHAATRDFYRQLDLALGTKDFYKKFTDHKVKTVDAGDVKDLKSLAKVFRYPAFLEFTPAATKHLNAQILADQLPTRLIDYYFGASDSYTSTVRLYQPAIHIIQTTRDAHLLWTAGDVLSIIWESLPADDNLDNIFKRQIYDLYWPRIGDIWPLANSSRIKFTSDADQKEFDDSLGWLFSLNNIAEYNPDIAKYLDFLNQFSVHQQYAENIPKPIINRAFWYKYHSASAKNMHDRILDELPEECIVDFLTHPETVEEAKLVFADILHGVFPIERVPYIFEKLLMSPKPAETQVFVIEYFTAHLDEFAKLLESFTPNEVYDRYVLSTMFQAACDGAKAQAEYDALYKLASKIKKLIILEDNAPELEETLSIALDYVARSVKDYSKAQKELIQLVAY